MKNGERLSLERIKEFLAASEEFRFEANNREELYSYFRWKQPKEWLFPGEKPGQPISSKSIFLACKRATKQAGISKPVHLPLKGHTSEYGRDLFLRRNESP
jgi:hypothetical protein